MTFEYNKCFERDILNDHFIEQKCPSIEVEWQPENELHFVLYFFNLSISPFTHSYIIFWAWSLHLWKDSQYIFVALRAQVYILRPTNFRWRSNWFTTPSQGGGNRKSCSKWNGIWWKLNSWNAVVLYYKHLLVLTLVKCLRGCKITLLEFVWLSSTVNFQACSQMVCKRNAYFHIGYICYIVKHEWYMCKHYGLAGH